jgi:hypothetical protein
VNKSAKVVLGESYLPRKPLNYLPWSKRASRWTRTGYKARASDERATYREVHIHQRCETLHFRIGIHPDSQPRGDSHLRISNSKCAGSTLKKESQTLTGGPALAR